MILEVSFLFGDNKRTLTKKESFLKSKSSLDKEMDRILARKSQVFERKDPSRESIFLSMVKSVLMLLIDRARRIRFSQNGLQQWQMDNYFIIQIAFELVTKDDESLIIGFYHEILESAKANCDEPSLLDQTILETTSNFRRSKMKI
eukprot:TRINITY_DN4407_c0_g1_i4.p1 TRINITY_DN4407_c0_g1~~TRINITY_DN4407_c0_g1_i4.p1  ORF type:complete len:146 (+),score=38.66 TRINITY_DN4407_c0_g1_i4:69-506(+)